MSLDTFGDLNWLAVLVGALAYFLVGAVWYAPPVFGRAWMADSGVQPGSGAGAYLVGSFFAQLLATIALAFLARAAGASDAADAVVLGLVVAVGFVLTTLGLTQWFEKRPARLTWINVGYHVVGLVVAALIVTLWE